MRAFTSCLFLAAALPFIRSSVASSPSVRSPETSHLAFVTEYIRELAANESVRSSAEDEINQAADTNEKLLSGIHGSTRIQLELRSQIGMLREMHLKAPFDTLVPNISSFYEQKIRLNQKLIDITTTFLGEPKSGVDYGKLTAEMPKTRAELDFIDESLLKCAPFVFATLIDQKPDSKNHMSHLVITKEERAQLIADLAEKFGSKLDEDKPGYIVATAQVLKAYLLKDYRCSDEPWE